MPLPQALSSIFLPSNSIYASIDQDARTGSSRLGGTSGFGTEHTSPGSPNETEFAPDSQTAINPFVSATPVVRDSTRLPSENADSLDSRSPPLLDAVPPTTHERLDTDQDDSNPFHEQHAERSSEGRGSTTRAGRSTRPLSPEHHSLMGLLGGTAYHPRSIAADPMTDQPLTTRTDSQQRGNVHSQDEAGHGFGIHRQESLVDSALRDSLPLSPSVFSPNLATFDSRADQKHEVNDLEDGSEGEGDEEEEEEEDDDAAPPDFTTRMPLLSSTLRSPQPAPTRRVRPLRPAASASISPSSGTRRNPSNGGILGHSPSPRGRNQMYSMSARERALWRWVNVEDLDKFLEEAYRYYLGKGVWTIGLERVLNLLTVGWVIGFSTFLIGCVDYPKLWRADRLSDAVVPKCVSRLSGFTSLLFILFVGFYAWRVAEFGLEVRSLWQMHEFYTELLEIPEDDIQTIPWHAIVTRLAHLRESHPSSLSSRQQSRDEPLDAHSVANRIMRSQNYLIALLNAPSVLNFSLPLPNIKLVKRFIGQDGRFGQGWLTKALEWNLNWTVLGFVFDERGIVREALLSERKRAELAQALKNRFILVGLLNALFAPFIVVYLLIYSFFRYFEEYHKNPSTISSRQFTPLAIYKFRSFNELEHEFSLRLSTVRPLANLYLSSYPRAKTALVSRFVAFLAGSFAAVLILFSIIDPDAFLHFEVTPGRTVLFWIGILGGVVAVARGMTPAQDGEAVRARLDPGEIMAEIVELSRYCPEEWQGRLHAYAVHQSFAPLFPPKPVLFAQELLSVLLTPLVLLFTLPNCATDIVDFFREFTVEVEGLGRVCSFALFDFKSHGARKATSTNTAPPKGATHVRQTSARSATAKLRNMESKMEKSFLNFAASNPEWQPRDEAQSLYLSQMLSEQPLTSAIHLPHQQHATSSTHHLHLRSPPPSRAQSQARSNRLPRFSMLNSIGPMADDGSSALAVRHRRAAEKAELYDRAFQRSALLASSNLSGYRRRNGNRVGGREGISEQDEVGGILEEESKLDGESFVAPTEELPYGNLAASEPDASAGRNQPVPTSNLAALVGELYRR
ncbi:autophagy protein ATG9 [Sporobolomyces koalae]|uniref:autophagy protein ATG9 n=1 Tax=Sporobolomyces koalae TaxID=500713 RepID=UPI0031708705